MRSFVAAIALFCCALVGVVNTAAQGQAQGPPPQGGQGGPPGAGGPGRGPQAPPENIKVLPKTWTGQQVRALMQTFTQSLGVTCAHCHAEDPTAPPPAAGQPPRLNYVLDTKKEKDIARNMIKMTMAANETYTKMLGDEAVPEKVSCFTCHRGDKKPVIIPDGGWTRGGFSLLPAGPPAGAARGRGGA